MPRRAKNGRFTKSSTTRRRRSPKTTNVSNIAQNLLVLNAVTKGMFDTDLKAFAGFGEKSEYDNSWEITAQELFSGLFGGNMGMSGDWQQRGLMKAIQRNLKENGGMMVAQLVMIPIAFKFGRKLLGRSLITPANRILKPAGVRL